MHLLEMFVEAVPCPVDFRTDNTFVDLRFFMDLFVADQQLVRVKLFTANMTFVAVNNLIVAVLLYHCSEGFSFLLLFILWEILYIDCLPS